MSPHRPDQNLTPHAEPPHGPSEATTVGIPRRTGGWFIAQGITDLGKRLHLPIASVTQGRGAHNLKPIRSKPNTPRTNSKAWRHGPGRLRRHPIH